MDTTFPIPLQPHVDKILTLCRAQLTEGDLTPTTYVINTATNGAAVPVQMHLPNTVIKEIAATMVRWTAKNIRADTTILATEAYTLSEAEVGRYEEIVTKYGSLGEYPGKLVILMVVVETRDGFWVGRAPIETRGEARRCGPLVVTKDDTMGRFFTRFLSPQETP